MTITNVEPGSSTLKDALDQEMQDNLYHGVKIEPIPLSSYSTENSRQSAVVSEETNDPLADIPVFEITPETAAVMRVSNMSGTSITPCSCKG